MILASDYIIQENMSFIDLVKEKYNLEKYNIDESEEKYYFYDVYELMIEFYPENDSFDIYAVFTHPLYATEEYTHEGIVKIYYSNKFKKMLEDEFLTIPELNYPLLLGAPFDEEYIGYFNVVNDIDFVSKFFEIYDLWMSEIPDFNFEDKEPNDILEQIIDTKWLDFKKLVKNKGYSDSTDEIIRVNRGIVFSKRTRENFEKEYFDNTLFNRISSEYIGDKYVLFVTGQGLVYSVDKEIYFESIRILSNVETLADEDKFIFKGAELKIYSNAIIATLKIDSNSELVRLREYYHFKEKFNQFKTFAPSEFVNDICLKKLSFEDFEKLCYEFLVCEKYSEVHPLGKATASDGGCDLFARKNVNGNIEKWIIQCKHTASKKKISFRREMFSEIPDLLYENSADHYLLITNTDLTPQIIRRIEIINERNGSIIQYYAVNEFKNALTKYPQLIHKYDLIERKMN